MRRRFPVLLVLALPFLTGCGGGGIQGLIDSVGGGSSPSDPNHGAGVGAMSPAEQADADAVLALVNVERAKEFLSPVALDVQASRAAYDHGVDMDTRGYFEHTSPAPNSTTPGQRLAAAGCSFSGWGENIAMGQPTPAVVMADWMSSPGHHANIMNPAFTHLGVGVRYGTGTVYWVQDFLTR